MTIRIIFGGMLPILLCPAVFCAGFDDGDKDGNPLASRSLEEIKKTLADIYTPPDKDLDPSARERHLALQRLRAYRYLAGIPFDVNLDNELNRYADAAAKLCQKLGRLDHNPSNPGMPEDEFKIGLKGTQSSNLGVGYATLTLAVDGWMGDSNSQNIDRIGHRRWCLNPAMRIVGFGRAGQFQAMSCFDASRKVVPDFDYVSWPPRGLMPVEYFKADNAWNVSLNTRKFQKATSAASAQIYPLDKDGKKSGEALPLNFKNVNTGGFGIPNCIIFRPSRIDIANGKQYAVEIAGIETVGGKAATIGFKVQFCELGLAKSSLQ